MYALIGTWRMCLDGARAGLSGLKAGGSAGDAVEKAIIDVEDRPEFFSVGYGGLPDRSGHVMLDAAFMDGGTLHIEWHDDNHVYMTGPAAFAFEGEIELP